MTSSRQDQSPRTRELRDENGYSYRSVVQLMSSVYSGKRDVIDVPESLYTPNDENEDSSVIN